MKNFVVGILQIVLASVCINFIYDGIDFSYLKTPVPQMTPIVIGVQTSNVRRTANNLGYVWKNLSELMEYKSKDFSYSHKVDLVKKYSPGWLDTGDEYDVLEQQFPYAKIRIAVPNKSYSYLHQISSYGTVGWISN